MRTRNGYRYVIKVFEAQWDQHHDESVKPFFEQLKRDTEETYARRNGYKHDRPGHDALFSYTVFQNAQGLKDALSRHDQGVDNRAKIGYVAAHGKRKAISAVKDISRTKLKNMIAHLSSYDGIFFGACDFANPDTARVLLGNSPHIKWVAGYENWVPWLEGMLCDLMFFRLLLSGRFVRPNTNARWEPISRPEDVAQNMYGLHPPARDLRFSLYYRTRDGISSTLEEHQGKG
jgi:hypothetical protein